MQRASLLIGISVAVTLAGVTWLAAAQLGGMETDSRSEGAPRAPVAKEKTDLNRAGLEELNRLPGISPQLAERIVKNRPYRKLDDLVSRRVLGKKQFARIRELVVVGSGGP